MLMEGRVEQVYGSTAVGWLSQPDSMVGKPKRAVFFSARGELASLDIEEHETDRADLQDLENARKITFTLDRDDLIHSVAMTLCFAAVVCEDERFPLLISRSVVRSVPLDGKSSELKGIAIGRVSDDGVAAMGASGKVFLKSGSNGLENMYRDGSLADNSAWLSLLKKRKSLCKSLGSDFIQLFFPEKTSLLHWLSPYHASRGTPAYRSLMAELTADSEVCDSVFDSLLYLPDEVGSEGVFRSYDTHMSTHGCKLVFEAFVGRYFPEIAGTFSPYEISHVELPGDLGGRFAADGPVFERVPVYRHARVKGVYESIAPDLIDSHNPAEGHVGIYRHWSSPGAPIKKKVLCFGGSSFERGDHSMMLSWWCARAFTEFKFFWSSECKEEVVAEYKPDLVICQTVERFIRPTPIR